ncbi:MAG: hypothetical protein DDT24_00921 [Chloroflexi bacterium]|nr:hypothetical protein [Chloroflexota bacterium]
MIFLIFSRYSSVICTRTGLTNAEETGVMHTNHEMGHFRCQERPSPVEHVAIISWFPYCSLKVICGVGAVLYKSLCLHFPLSQIRFCPSRRVTATYKVQR